MASLFTAGLKADSTSSTSCLLHGCYHRIVSCSARLGSSSSSGSSLSVRQRWCPVEVLWRRSLCVQFDSIRGFLPSTDRPPRPQREFSSHQAVDFFQQLHRLGRSEVSVRTNTTWQSLLVVVGGPSFFVRAGCCRPIGVELIPS